MTSGIDVIEMNLSFHIATKPKQSLWDTTALYWQEGGTDGLPNLGLHTMVISAIRNLPRDTIYHRDLWHSPLLVNGFGAVLHIALMTKVGLHNTHKHTQIQLQQCKSYRGKLCDNANLHNDKVCLHISAITLYSSYQCIITLISAMALK